MQVAEEGGGGGVEPRNDSSPQFRPRARTSRPSGSVQTDRLMAAVWADNLEADVASPSRTQDPVAATPPSRRRASPRSFSDAAGFVASEKGSFTRSHLADILEADANDDGDFTGVLTGRKLMSTDGLSDASAPMASEKDLNSGSSDTSSPKVKLMCSFEGQILPRPIDGKLRYVGGETRVISVSRNIRIAELLRRLTELYDRAVVLKYQLPEEDLDALVSVSTDEDLENMMEESDKLLSSSVGGGSSLPSKIRVFLFPPSGGSDASSMVGMEDRRDSEQRYIDAINEAVDTSVRKQFDVSSRGSSQNLVGFEIAEAAHSLSSSPSGIMQASVTSWVPIDPVLPPLNNISNNNDNNNNDRNTSNSNNRRDPSIGRRFGSNMSSSFPSHQPDKRLDTRFTQSPLPPTDSLGVDMPEKQLDSLWKPDFEGHYGNSQTSHLASLPTSETIPLPPYQKGGGDVQDVESGFGGELISNYNEIPQPSEAPILSKLETLESFPSSMRGSFRLISSSSEEPLSNLLPFIDSKDPTFLRSEHNADELEFLSGMWMTMSSPKENQEFTDSQWKTQIEIHDESRSNIFLTPLCDPPMGQTASFSPSQDDQETGNGNSLQRSKEPHLDENLSILSQSIDSGAPSFRCGEHDDVDEVGFLTGAWVVPLISQKIESKESERGSTDSCERSSYDFFGVSPSSAKKQEEAHESHSNNEAVPTSSFEDSQDITLGNSMGQTEERRSEEHSSSLTPLLDGVDPADPSFRRSEHIDVDEAGFLTGAWMTSSLNQKTVSASASSSSSSSSEEESEGSVDCNEQLYSFLSKDSHLRTQVEMGNTSSSPPAVRETHSSQSDSFPSHFPSGPISSSSSSATSSVVQDNHETRNGNPLQQTQEPLLTPPPLLIRNELDVAGESGFSTGTWMTLLSQMVSKQSKGSNDSYEQSYAVLSADYQRRAQLDSKHPLSNSPKIHSDNVELIPSLSPSYIKSSSFLNQASKSPQGLQDGSSTQMNTGEETTPVTSSKPSDSVPSSSEGGKWDNILSVDDLLGLTAKKELNRIDSGTSKSEGDNHPSFKQENSAFVGYSSVDFLFLHRKHTEETPLAIKQSDKDSPLPSIIRHPLLANPESGATAMPGVEGIEEVIVLESSDSAKPVFPVFESQQEEQKERDRMFDQNWEKVLQEAEAEEQLLTANANEEISKADLELEKEGGNYEEAKIEDTSIPRNVAAEAEAEAISRGLQIIRNADLEERRELGSGTFGTVYHGKWRGTDVAIKRIKSSCFMGRPAERESLMADFWREAIILGQLHHPNVVAFYGVVPDGPGGTLATVTEFMVNGSLKHVLQTKDRSIDHRKRLLIAMDAAFGMEYLHGKRIVHFDLKCENLLVNMRDPHRPICKVGDLGLSKVKQQTMVSGGVRGTLPWMAPELLNGSSNLVSERVDVFSFGIAMWEILTGMEPYQNMHYGAIIGGIASNTLRPSIPRSCNPAWKSLMVRCWSADPMERPPFSEIARELRSMAALVQPKTQQAKA